jgi:hypothetical protein
MVRWFRRFPLAALVIALLAWLPVGVAQAEAGPAHTEKRNDNPCGAPVRLSESVPAALPDARLTDASSLLAQELGQVLFLGHRR